MSLTEHDVAARLQAVRQRIARACQSAGRDPGSVALVAVSKGHGPAVVKEAYDAGQRVFGENYAQELATKATALAQCLGVSWRFIGHLQRNKAQLVVPMAHSVDAVDSIRLAKALDGQASRCGKRLNVLIQVNVAGEAQKAGCSVDDLDAVVDATRACDHLKFDGFMTIPPFDANPEAARPHFARLRTLAAKYASAELSMGMSSDLEVAIEEGATIVRVGTAIFGPRSKDVKSRA